MGLSSGQLAVRGLRVVLAKVGILTNNPALLNMPAYFDSDLQEANPRIWSFLSSLYRVEEIHFGPDMDGYIYIFDSEEAEPEIVATPDRLVISGDISRYEREVEVNPTARRWSLFSNGGILSKFSYTLLERCYGILSFHAASMYDEARDEMYVIVGPPGAGKTVMMLEGCLRRGYRIFATEMTHVRFDDGKATFYKGSLYDNIRIKTLTEGYPEARELLDIRSMTPEIRGEAKIGVSFARVQTRSNIIVNPRMNWLFPRIEAENSKAVFSDIKDDATLVRMLYENASEMIVRPRIYYGRLALSEIGYPRSSSHRMQLCQRLVRDTVMSQAKSIYAGPQNCMAEVR